MKRITVPTNANAETQESPMADDTRTDLPSPIRAHIAGVIQPGQHHPVVNLPVGMFSHDEQVLIAALPADADVSVVPTDNGFVVEVTTDD